MRKMTGMNKALTTYTILKGSSVGLSFTADGEFADFVGVKVNGTLIDATDYTAKSGSTVVTLNASYLKTLKVGNYSIAICFGEGEFYGEAQGTFKVYNTAGNPFTGDGSHIGFYTGTALASLLSMAMMTLFLSRKKDRYQR